MEEAGICGQPEVRYNENISRRDSVVSAVKASSWSGGDSATVDLSLCVGWAKRMSELVVMVSPWDVGIQSDIQGLSYFWFQIEEKSSHFLLSLTLVVLVSWFSKSISAHNVGQGFWPTPPDKNSFNPFLQWNLKRQVLQ